MPSPRTPFIPDWWNCAIAAHVAVHGRATVENLVEMARHIATLHPRGSDGCITLASKVGGVYRETSHRAGQPLKRFELAGKHFVSMNRFMRRKTGKLLASVGHTWLDFDPYADDARGNPLPYRGMAPEALMAILAKAIAEAGLPTPSYWTASGRGLHAVWVCESLPGRAASKVARILKELYGPTLNEDGSVPARKRSDPDRDLQEARLAPMWRLFRDAGLDQQTKDSARILRLWGSVNSESGLLCRRIWPEFSEDIQRCRVDALADAVLPLTNDAFKARMAGKAATSPIEDVKPAKPRKAGWSYSPKAGVWDRKLADLLRYREHVGFVPKGKRHLWAFLTANAMAHAKGGTVADWASALAPLAGLRVDDVRSSLASLGRRHDRHLSGETSEHGGTAWSPLFHHRGSTMAELLGLTDEFCAEAGMQSVRPSGTLALTSTQRSVQKRIKDGAIAQGTRAETKAEAGRQGLAMLAEGRSKAETYATLGALFGKGSTWCKEAVRDASDAVPIDAGAEVASIGSKDVETVGRFSGRSIGGSAPAPASAGVSSLPAAPAEAVEEVAIEANAPVLYDRPRIRRLSSISTEYRTGPSTGFWVIRDPYLKTVSALSFDGQDVDVPEDYHLAAKAARQARSVAYQTGARRSTGRTPQRGRAVAVDRAQAADEYRRASQGF